MPTENERLLFDTMVTTYLEDSCREASKDFIPSVRYQRWIRRQIYRDRGAYMFTGWRKGLLTAMIAVAFIIGSLMTVEAVREHIAGFFYEVFGEWLQIGHDDSPDQPTPETIEAHHLPKFIPPGYEQSEKVVYTSVAYAVWTSSTGETIRIEQWVLDANIEFKADNTQEIMIGDIRVLYQELDDHHAYYWTASAYQYYLNVTEEFPLDTIESIILSIQ